MLAHCRQNHNAPLSTFRPQNQSIIDQPNRSPSRHYSEFYTPINKRRQLSIKFTQSYDSQSSDDSGRGSHRFIWSPKLDRSQKFVNNTISSSLPSTPIINKSFYYTTVDDEKSIIDNNEDSQCSKNILVDILLDHEESTAGFALNFHGLENSAVKKIEVASIIPSKF